MIVMCVLHPRANILRRPSHPAQHPICSPAYPCRGFFHYSSSARPEPAQSSATREKSKTGNPEYREQHPARKTSEGTCRNYRTAVSSRPRTRSFGMPSSIITEGFPCHCSNRGRTSPHTPFRGKDAIRFEDPIPLRRKTLPLRGRIGTSRPGRTPRCPCSPQKVPQSSQFVVSCGVIGQECRCASKQNRSGRDHGDRIV